MLPPSLPPLPPLIGLCGYPGSGKDLLASHLVMLGYQVLSFAANLRNELEHLAKTQTPPPPELLSLPPSSSARLGWLRMLSNPKALWAKPTESPIRHLLQWYGTDYRRQSDPSHWVDSLASDYRLLQSLKTIFLPNHTQFHVPLIPVVIPDVRFENEAQWITSNSGTLFLIDNPEAKSKYLLTTPNTNPTTSNPSSNTSPTPSPTPKPNTTWPTNSSNTSSPPPIPKPIFFQPFTKNHPTPSKVQLQVLFLPRKEPPNGTNHSIHPLQHFQPQPNPG